MVVIFKKLTKGPSKDDHLHFEKYHQHANVQQLVIIQEDLHYETITNVFHIYHTPPENVCSCMLAIKRCVLPTKL